MMQAQFPDSHADCRWFIREEVMERLESELFFYVNEWQDNQQFTLLGCPFQIVTGLKDMRPDFMPMVLVHNNGWTVLTREGQPVMEYVGTEPPKSDWGPIS